MLFLVSTSIFELFTCYLLCTSLCPTTFLRDHSKNKFTQLFFVMSAMAPYRVIFYQSFVFNDFIFEYIVNFSFICFDGERY